MGYQESYLYSKNFNELETLIQTKGYDYFKNDKWATPVVVVTLKRRIIHFNTGEGFRKGTKFIYIVGDRSNQRNPDDLFDGDQPEGTRMIFTENFPSDEIFTDDGKSKIANIEEFEWNKKTEQFEIYETIQKEGIN